MWWILHVAVMITLENSLETRVFTWRERFKTLEACSVAAERILENSDTLSAECVHDVQ